MSELIELVQGPVAKWEPSEKDKVTVERLLESEHELNNAYGEAYQEDCFVTEFGGPNENSGIAAVGEMQTLAVAEFRLGIEMDPAELSMGACIELGAFPGRGETRAERVRDGLRQVIEARNESEEPDALDLFGSFTESGYKVDALMPRNSSQPCLWTIRVYKEGDEDIFREETIPMLHEPIFGVDIGDKATLEARVENIMKELFASD